MEADSAGPQMQPFEATARLLVMGESEAVALASARRIRVAAEAQRETFSEFVERSLPSLLRFGHVLTSSASDAEDLVAEALARAQLSWDRIRRQDQPEVYVRKAMVRLNISRLRRLARQLSLFERATRTGCASRATGEEIVEERIVLANALKRLAPGQRSVLVLRYYLGLSEAEAAKYLGCSVGNVKSQAARALRNAREAIRATSRT